MKDLFILTADADALAFMKTLLGRYEALAIRPITFESIRHPMKDAGVIKDGPETARLFKLKCGKALLLWDYHGSGQEKRCSPEDSMKMLENRLDGVSWQDNSGAVVVVPELEKWLWYSPASIATYFGLEQDKLNEWVEDYARKNRTTPEKVIHGSLKELFEYVCLDKLKRSISPRDFEGIGRIADVRALLQSRSFSKMVTLLRQWFPA